MMSESKKNSKIEPIFISDEMLEEDNFDSKLRDKMIEDAEEIEKALETDPKLDGIEAPAGMLDSITASLKNQGYWEDEEASEVSVGQKEELTEIDAAEDEDILEQQEIMRKAAGAEGLSDDEIYQMLSPEDREALKLGKRIKSRKRWQGPLIKVACGVMILGGVFGLSMTSEANRKYIIGIWNSIVRNELNIHVEDSEANLYKNSTEEDIYKQIQNVLNVNYVNFIHNDSNLVYDNLTIDQRAGEAKVYYVYKDTIALFRVSKGSESSSKVQKFDGPVLDTINSNYNNTEWIITEIDNPGDEMVYVAQTQIGEVCYSFRAIMSKDEFIDTIQNIIIE